MQERYRAFSAILSAAALALAWGGLAGAQLSENSPSGDVFIEGQLCVSDDDDCGSAEAFVDFVEIKVKDSIPGIYFENTTGDMGDETDWQIKTDLDQFRLIDRGAAGAGANEVFNITAGAPEDALTILSNGNVGFGTSTPSAPLHVKRSNGAAQLFVEETSGTESSRTLLQVTNNGEAKFGFNNTAFARQWEFFASVGFSINEITNPGLEFVFTPTGDLNMTGTLTTGGPTCGGGCDEVFQPGGAVESIEDHAAAMWENSHLPGVGPTQPDQRMNLSEKVGGLINELEKAHIYIERLHERLKTAAAEAARKDARVAGLEQRLSRVEAALATVAP